MKSGKRLAKILAKETYSRMAYDIVLYDVRRRCDYCDYFLIMSAKNKLHADALKEKVVEVVAAKDATLLGVDGNPESGWIIVDTGALMVHVFLPGAREFYSLHTLWGDAKLVELELI